MRSGLYLLSGAAIGIAFASFLLWMPTANAPSSADQNVMLKAEYENSSTNAGRLSRNAIHSERNIRVILPSPYAGADPAL